MLLKAAESRLNTTFTESLNFLEKHFYSRCADIEKWFASEWQRTPPPVYGSVDLRNAGFKLAPIDMNLFPAGFNNLNPSFMPISVESAKKTIHRLVPHAQNILLIPENHTRNLFYWDNVSTLQIILEQAGFTVRIGSLSEAALPAQTLTSHNGNQLVIEKITREDNMITVPHFTPDMIFLNNDLSDGIPDILQSLDQPVIPPAELGWSQRLKSEHFQYYAEVANEFSKLMEIDPWLIAPLFRHCGQIDFMQQGGLDCLISNAETLFEEIQKKYAEYKIPYEPFLIVKADAGTYGMAVMTVRNVEELRTINRKQRTRMSATKGGHPVKRVIIQEGVYTFETIGAEHSVAEPVVYLLGDNVVGGFYRVHKERGVDENLNAPGMHFEPIAFAQPCHQPCSKGQNIQQNRLYLYGVIAKLSTLAAAREMRELR